MEIVDNITPDQRSACLRIAKALRDAGGRALLVVCAGWSAGCGVKGYRYGGLRPVNGAGGVSAGQGFQLDAWSCFGVFIVKGYGIDVALPRRESKTGPKHTDFRVEGDPTMSPEEAALRRDLRSTR